MNRKVYSPSFVLSLLLITLLLALAAGSAQAQTTNIWANANITATPVTALDWFTGGPNTQATWTGGTPASGNVNTIQFFQDTTTVLVNTVAATNTANVNNGGTAFELGTLTLNGKAGTSASLTETISGDPLKFSGSTGTINANALNNANKLLTYNLNSAVQLGTASSSCELTITGTGYANAATVPVLTINGVISELQTGGGSILKSGSSCVSIANSANAFTGGITLGGGAIKWGGVAQALNGNDVTFTANTVMEVFNTAANRTNTGAITVNPSVVASYSIPSAAWGFTSTGPLKGSGTVTVQGASATGVILNFLNANNTFTGPLNNSTGTTSGGGFNVASLADSANAITMGSSGTSAATFSLDATTPSPVVFSSRQFVMGTAGAYTLNLNNNASSAANTFAINTDLSVTGSGAKTFSLGGTNPGTNTFAGTIANGSGTIGLTKAGAGTWIISGPNTYTGPTTISASGGTLVISSIDNVANANPLGQSSVNATNLLLGNSSTLQYIGAGGSTDRGFTINGTASGNQATLDASGTGPITFTSTASPAYGTTNQSRVLILTGTNTGNNTLAANLVNNGINGTNVSITKSGAGTWVLTGTSSTHVGPTTINAGVLAVAKLADGGLPSSIGQSANVAGNLKIGSGATLRYVGAGDSTDRTFQMTGSAAGNNCILDASGTGPINFTSATSPANTTVNTNYFLKLTGTNSGNNTFAANMSDNGTGKRNLTKDGVGTWVLTGASTYTGTTAIDAGTLVLGANNALASGTAVTLGNATLNAGTYSNSVSTLDVTGAGTINLGSGGTLAFANSSAKAWSGGALTVTGTFVPSSSLRFGTSNAGLTGTQLSQISISGHPTLALNGSGYLIDALVLSAPTISGVTASPSISYGTATVALSGTVSAPGPVYPANGETVSVTINGSTTNAIIAGGAGGFAVNFNTATMPVTGSPFTIAYVYAGNGTTLSGATNNSTTLTVTKADPIVTVMVGTYYGNGSPQGPTAYTTSPTGDTGAPTWSYVGTGTNVYGPTATLPTAVGTYTAMVSLAADGNFNVATSTATAFTIIFDNTAPTPNPMTFASVPTALSSSIIRMTATTATDETSTVQYYFTETTGHPGGASSGWQTSPVYTNSGLNPNTTYTYTVKARDQSLNETTASAPASATTPVMTVGLSTSGTVYKLYDQNEATAGTFNGFSRPANGLSTPYFISLYNSTLRFSTGFGDNGNPTNSVSATIPVNVTNTGTVLDYRFYTGSAFIEATNGPADVIGGLSYTTNSGTALSTRGNGMLWIGHNPDNAYPFGTTSDNGQGWGSSRMSTVTVTNNISGLTNGTIYVFYGLREATNASLTATMKDSTLVSPPINLSTFGSINNTTLAWYVTSFDFVNDGSYDTIEYTYSSSPAGGGAFFGTVLVGPATSTLALYGTLGAVDTTYGTASPIPTNFTVAGANLTGAPGNLTVTPPAGYEVSLSSGSGYSTSLSVPYSSATLSGATVYVRLAATTPVGVYSGNITVVGGGATSQTIATVASTVSVPPPSITGSTNFVSAFSTTFGTPSAAQSFAVTGANLTADITATAAVGFEVSTNPSTVYGSTATLPQSGGSASGTVYIRLSATAAVGTYNSSNIVVLTSAGATSITNTSSASGNVVNAGTPGNFSGISVSGTGLTLTVTNGVPNGVWTLLESTNLLVPVAQWPTNRMGNYDGSGNLTTNIVNAATNPAAFYLLK